MIVAIIIAHSDVIVVGIVGVVYLVRHIVRRDKYDRRESIR
jgi:hypothetical protein